MKVRALALGAVLLGACSASGPTIPTPTTIPPATPAAEQTPLPTREPHPPAELVPYVAQSGDTLAAIAAHFSTSAEAILQANPLLPPGISTLSSGYELRIPAYYLPLTGTPFKMLPDSEVINGPSAVGFDIRSEMLARPGYGSDLSDYAFRLERPAWEVVNVVARNYSINPRLLLALLEYRAAALTSPFPDEQQRTYPLGLTDTRYKGLFRQLLWAAERINDGYYGWRSGTLREFETADGMLYRPDSWQNAGTVAVQMVFAGLLDVKEFEKTVGPDGFAATYSNLWGSPFSAAVDLFPENLQQPELLLPFVPNRIWDFTGGPHYSWGTSLPLGALDFGPPASVSGCSPSGEWVTAPAAGIVTRSEEATVVLDLDEDSDERTGWSLFFFHIAEEGRIQAGVEVEVGDLLGHPSCEGGTATGTHFHLARRYNGEWLPADGALPFVMDGWVAKQGAALYEGTLVKGSKVVAACTCSTRENRILYELPGGDA